MMKLAYCIVLVLLPIGSARSRQSGFKTLTMPREFQTLKLNVIASFSSGVKVTVCNRL